MPLDSVAQRIRAEFLEMPGMHLTAPQVQRLCGVEQLECHAALDALVEMKFLYVRPNGTYTRLGDGADVAPPRQPDVALGTRNGLPTT